MGLIKTALRSARGILAEQWKEYFYCDAMDADVLMAKGVQKGSRRGSSNIITNGSVIAVNEGQCAMIVEKGRIVEFTAEAGEFTWDDSTEGTIFQGDLYDGLMSSWDNLKKRFTFGGEAPKDQRVYFFNLKEITGNKYGTPAPVPFRVVDKNIGLDVDISVRCNGEYSYRITDPILFYKNVCANVSGSFTRDEIDSQLKSEFLTALQPAFARISSLGIRYSALPGHTLELSDAMNDALSYKWSDLRGISVVSVGINSITASREDEEMIKELQKSAVFRNPGMAGAHMVQAQAEAMKTAAANAGGAMTGFMGMGMAQQAGGVNAAQLFQMAGQQSAPAAPASPADGWKCSCGAENTGKFCAECGARKPKAAPLYRCDKCGWEPEDPQNPPRFCPECGDRFNDEDIQ